jgi:hypothetical protein
MSDSPSPPRREDAGDVIARLLRLAGPRQRAPRERAERVRATVERQWRLAVRRRRRTRQALWLGGVALAASVAGWLAVLRPEAPVPPAEAPLVATLEAVAGVPRTAAGVAALAPATLGDGLRAGAWLETAAGDRAALRLLTGASLRVDVDTRLRLLSATRLELVRGAVYVDSGATPLAATLLEVETPWGVARDIGTQFEVRVPGLPASALRVRVREGRVELDREGERHEAAAGLELEMDTTGRLARRPVAHNGPDWAWTLAIAPPFELEGRRLADFLAWVTRETGLRVRFADPALEYTTADIVLHGSLRGIPPDQAPAAVLPTCGLTHTVEDGALVVAASPLVARR